jgi:LemA protein
MNKRMIGPLAGVGIFILIAIAFGACQYNRLATAEEDVDGAWAQVENVLQRRADLVPNLVETVKAFAAHEQQVFGDIAESRSRLLAARSPNEAAEANASMTSALGRLMAISEAYPQLRSNENFIRLQDELAGTENRIAVERMRYNDAVRAYNTRIRRFPARMFAGMFGFDAKQYFAAEETAREAPRVNFGN